MSNPSAARAMGVEEEERRSGRRSGEQRAASAATDAGYPSSRPHPLLLSLLLFPYP
jgi:hypothetical protein